VIYTRCCIDTINSPDDGHMAAKNMYRIEINIHEKELCQVGYLQRLILTCQGTQENLLDVAGLTSRT
jgi:hypothetical protein